jgi:uncharacterized delta-60 repeat protein
MTRVAFRLPLFASVPGILLGLALLFVHGLANAAGKLDASYGAQGMYRTEDRWVPLVLPHPDGRSVFVVSTQADNCCSNSDAYVRLLDAQGRPQPYGDGGWAQFQLFAVAAGVALPDGGVILGGSNDEGGGFLASLSTTGARGRFFAGNPVLATGEVTAIARDREGGILFAERGPYAPSCVPGGWRIRRLNAAGEPDAGWGDRGTVTSLEVEGSRSFTCEVSHLWVTPAGNRMVATAGRKIFRLRADGGVDPEFTPIAVPGSGSQFQVMSLADGRLLVAATAPHAEHTTIWRYDDRGSLDRSFGSGAGEVKVNLALAATGSSSAQEAPTSNLVVGDDGRHIYLTAWAYEHPAGALSEPQGVGEVVARLTQDGRLDSTFGDNGVVRLTRALQVGVHGLFPHPDGSLLIATAGGVLKLAGGDESSPGLVDAYFSPGSVLAGQRLQLVVSRLAGSDGKVTVLVDAGSPSVAVVPFRQTLTWGHGEAGDKTVEIQTLAGGPAEGILTVRLAATGGKPLVLRDPLYAYVKGSTSSTPPPPAPPPATTPPPTGAPGGGSGGSGGGGALGRDAVLWLLLLALGAARKVAPAGGRRT